MFYDIVHVLLRTCEEEVKYSIEECKERDATYAAPLKMNVRLHNKETDEINQHDIFMGDLPLMTETGTFVINGAERVRRILFHTCQNLWFITKQFTNLFIGSNSQRTNQYGNRHFSG